ncbi:hypothetical protein Tco_0627718 [Tanacetum coccineum]|uniref:Uncharacterized protein n=1 Tax=Tanacetum coccineum TaxID=301880 RepID=A0ABQ4WN83_9ASTR
MEMMICGDFNPDDTDDEDEDKGDEDDEDEEEEEEHLDPADSAVVVPTLGLLSGFRLPYPIPARGRGRDLLSHATPTTITTYSLSPTRCRERLARCMAPSAHSSPPPVPSPLLPSSPISPPEGTKLVIPPPVDRRYDVPESELPPRKKLCLSTLGSRYEVKEGSTARPTGDPAEAVPEIAPMTLEEVNTRVTELAELHEHDTQDLYALLEDAQEGRTRISQRVTIDSQQVDLLMEDRIAHQETILIVEEEAYAS